MERKRKKYSAEFKIEVALAALQNQMTVSEITEKSTLESTQSTSKSMQSTSQSTSEFVLSSTAKEILLTIEQNPLITYDEIADKMGKARSGIARHIKNLQKKGLLIAKGESGEWTFVKSSICQKGKS